MSLGSGSGCARLLAMICSDGPVLGRSKLVEFDICPVTPGMLGRFVHQPFLPELKQRRFDDLVHRWPENNIEGRSL